MYADLVDLGHHPYHEHLGCLKMASAWEDVESTTWITIECLEGKES